MPRAYMEMIFASKSGNRRWYLAIGCGSKVPARSRGISSVTFDVPVRTVFYDRPLWRLVFPSAVSASRCASSSAFRTRSDSPFFNSSSRPSWVNTVSGSRPSNSWSNSSFSIAIGCSFLFHHYGPKHKIPDTPSSPFIGRQESRIAGLQPESTGRRASVRSVEA